MNLGERFLYIHSCDLQIPVQIKVGSLEGKFDRPTYEVLSRDPTLQHCITLRTDTACSTSHGIAAGPASDYRPSEAEADGGNRRSAPPSFNLVVECKVYTDAKCLPVSIETPYKSFTLRCNWNTWLTLPICYNELSRDARLTFSIYDYHDNNSNNSQLEPHIIAGTCLNLFSKRGLFRQGMYDLKLWPFVQGDGLNVPSTTPGKLKTKQQSLNNNNKICCQMNRLAKLSKKHRAGLLDKVDWLDRLTFREIELVNESEKRYSNNLYLNVEFPFVHFDQVEHSIVYFEPNAEQYTLFQPMPQLVTAPDPEMGLENLVEAKHHILARSARIGFGDKELKPNAQTRDILNAIIDYPPSMDLSSEEKDLIWKFRFFLQANKSALAKFVRCVNWHLQNEARQAVAIMNDWTPMEVDASLELLSSRYQHKSVRRYAVGRLKEATNDELMLYLPQLVQALKYENFKQIHSGADPSFVQEMTAVDKTWQIDGEYGKCPELAFGEEAKNDENLEDAINDNNYLDVQQLPYMVHFDERTMETTSTRRKSSAIDNNDDNEDANDLATFLIARSCKDPLIANYLYWFLKVECDTSSTTTSTTDAADTKKTTDGENDAGQIKDMYTTVLSRLSKALAKGGVEARKRRTQLLLQQRFVNRLVKITNAMMKESGNRRKKIDFLQHMLAEQQRHDEVVDLANLEALPLPLDPAIRIQSVIPDQATVFNSANMPCKLVFRCSDTRTEYTTIFKHGDDLRQDQLIVQIITLMDRCLRRENLDLKLTPYKVLATSTSHGFVQFIESQPLRDVLHDWNTVQDFFRHFGADPQGPYGIEAEILDNYVKSCAGYSVISYLLGIGDRHQHNLLLCKNGRLFHVDFGYILGRDPKPMPPPMKLTKEMIEGMGGFASLQFQEFRRLCYTGFLHLRRHANLFLNLFALMVDASIPDIALEPDKAVKKVQERFLLHLSDEEAVRSIQQLIDDSISAKMAAFVDMMHDVAQYLRA